MANVTVKSKSDKYFFVVKLPRKKLVTSLAAYKSYDEALESGEMYVKLEAMKEILKEKKYDII